MATTDRRISYFNTLLFTIITGIVSLGVLSLLFFEFGKPYIYFIIAFEVGVFTIIGYCIYKIVSAEKAKADKKDKYVVRFDECPDYYSLKVIDNKDYCVNEYVTKTSRGELRISRLTPVNTTDNRPNAVPTVINLATSSKAYEINKFPLRGIEDDPNIPTFEEKCKLLYKVPPEEDKYKDHMFYTRIPWTFAKSRCASLGA